jgi:tetratricopeptide (TPR) repeat protein
MFTKNSVLVAALACLAAYSILAAVVHLGWAPTHSRLVERAEVSLSDARDALAGNGPAEERWARYRKGLAEAEVALRQAVYMVPVSGESAIALAAVLWETAPPPAGPARSDLVRLAQAGAAVVPYRSKAQRRAGDLLLRMGETDAGVARLSAAVEHDPQSTRAVVDSLISRGLEPERVRELLPNTAAVLVELASAYPQPEAWLTAVESFPGLPSKSLLLRYGTRCREVGDHERLRRHLAQLGEQPEVDVEVERLVQHADALLALGDVSSALERAGRARKLAPQDVRAAEYLGTVLLRGGDAEMAATVFGEALRTAALGGRSVTDRARLYRRLGQAHEARLRPDLAVDAYRLAVGLDSGEVAARTRLVALGSALAP